MEKGVSAGTVTHIRHLAAEKKKGGESPDDEISRRIICSGSFACCESGDCISVQKGITCQKNRCKMERFFQKLSRARVAAGGDAAFQRDRLRDFCALFNILRTPQTTWKFLFVCFYSFFLTIVTARNPRATFAALWSVEKLLRIFPSVLFTKLA